MTIMKISTMLSYSGGFRKAAAEVAEMEKAGLDLVWVAEAYGHRSPSQMGYLAALTETGGDRLGHPSDLHPYPDADCHDRGRHRRPFRGPVPPRVRFIWPPGHRGLARCAVRCADRPHPRDHRDLSPGWAREAPLVHEGTYYNMPLPPRPGNRAGQGAQDHRSPGAPRIPVWVAALGEKNVAMAAEVADGWIPMLFVPEKAHEVWGSPSMLELPSATRHLARSRSPSADRWRSAKGKR